MSLADRNQPKLVKTAEGSQISGREGSVRHVEVFQMVGVRTPILGRPRPLPGHRRAGPAHTPPTPWIVMSPFTSARSAANLRGTPKDVET